MHAFILSNMIKYEATTIWTPSLAMKRENKIYPNQTAAWLISNSASRCMLSIKDKTSLSVPVQLLSSVLILSYALHFATFFGNCRHQTCNRPKQIRNDTDHLSDQQLLSERICKFPSAVWINTDETACNIMNPPIFVTKFVCSHALRTWIRFIKRNLHPQKLSQCYNKGQSTASVYVRKYMKPFWRKNKISKKIILPFTATLLHIPYSLANHPSKPRIR